jgi:hypothetical protein
MLVDNQKESHHCKFHQEFQQTQGDDDRLSVKPQLVRVEQQRQVNGLSNLHHSGQALLLDVEYCHTVPVIKDRVFHVHLSISEVRMTDITLVILLGKPFKVASI